MKKWLLAATLSPLLLATSVGAQETYLLVVSGLGGEESYSETFYRWSTSLLEAARSAGVPDTHLTYLAEDEERAPDAIDARASRENVERALAELAAKTGPEDQVWIILVGHGSYQGGSSRFNLPGRDMTEADFATPLKAFQSRVAFVHTGSSSGGFVAALSGENRVVVTATKSGFERNETVFGEYFATAFSDIEKQADTNKDDRVSILEGFQYAQRQVGRFYEEQNRLLTEHSILDDNGDGQGSPEPTTTSDDGLLASRFFLAPAPEAAADLSPELVALLKAKRRIEERVEELRAQKDTLTEELYLEELETLLLDLATKTRAIRKLQGSGEN